MTTGKHTPGPWTLNEEFLKRRIYARGKNIFGIVALVNTDWPHPEQQAEQRANARLIAAAPDRCCA
jgi:hypothetical protein